MGHTLIQNSPTWLPTKIFSITSFVPSFATPTAIAENTNIATPSENGDTGTGSTSGSSGTGGTGQ